MNVWTASHSESNAGTLSARNSATASTAAEPITHGDVSTASVSGR